MMKAFLSLLLGTQLGVVFSRPVRIEARLTGAARTCIETCVNTHLCGPVNTRLVADGGTATCAAGRDGDALTVSWTGTGAPRTVDASFTSSHPYTATPQ